MTATYPAMAYTFYISFMIIIVNLVLWMFLAFILESYSIVRQVSRLTRRVTRWLLVDSNPVACRSLFSVPLFGTTSTQPLPPSQTCSPPALEDSARAEASRAYPGQTSSLLHAPGLSATLNQYR